MNEPPAILSFEAFVAQKNRKAGQKRKSLPPYLPRDDHLTVADGTSSATDTDPFYVTQVKIDRILSQMTDELRHILGSSELHNEQLTLIQNTINTIQVTHTRRPVVVPLVGHQGRGKSLLINALLHRKNLGKTSDSGRGCTSCPIEYEHTPMFGDLDDLHTVKVERKSSAELRQVITSYVDKWYLYRDTLRHDSSRGSADGQEELTEDANEAEQVFKWLCDANNNLSEQTLLNDLLQRTEPSRDAIVEHCLCRAELLLRKHGFDESSFKHMTCLKGEDLASSLAPYVEHDDDKPALWLLMKRGVVFIGSTVLGDRLKIIDLPGLGDANRARTAPTNIVRRKADYEIIVDVSGRILDEDSVHAQLKQSIKAHGASRTILVMTMIDDFLSNSHALENALRDKMTEPFPTIRRYLHNAVATVAAFDEAEEESNDKYDSEAHTDWQDYVDYLQNKAKTIYIRDRAQHLESSMIQKCQQWAIDPDPIRVFSVSSMVYLEWIGKIPRYKQPVLSPSECGIPALRQFLRTLSPKGLRDTYKKHISRDLPELLAKIDGVVGNLHEKGYGVIREAVGEAAQTVKIERLARLDDLLRNKFGTSWVRLSSKKADRRRQLDHTVAKWSNKVWYTRFAKCLKSGGIPVYKGKRPYRPINWNEDLLRFLQPDIDEWQGLIAQDITTFADAFIEQQKTHCKAIHTAISSASHNDSMKSAAQSHWRTHEYYILKAAEVLKKDMRDQFKKTLHMLTTEDDSECTIAKMNFSTFRDIYQRFPPGPGRYDKQRKALRDAFWGDGDIDSTFLARFGRHAIREMGAAMREPFETFLGVWSQELRFFDERLSTLEAPSRGISEEGKAITAQLREYRPAFARQIQELKTLFKGCHEADNEDGEQEVKKMRH